MIKSCLVGTLDINWYRRGRLRSWRYLYRWDLRWCRRRAYCRRSCDWWGYYRRGCCWRGRRWWSRNWWSRDWWSRDRRDGNRGSSRSWNWRGWWSNYWRRRRWRWVIWIICSPYLNVIVSISDPSADQSQVYFLRIIYHIGNPNTSGCRGVVAIGIRKAVTDEIVGNCSIKHVHSECECIVCWCSWWKLQDPAAHTVEKHATSLLGLESLCYSEGRCDLVTLRWTVRGEAACPVSLVRIFSRNYVITAHVPWGSRAGSCRTTAITSSIVRSIRAEVHSSIYTTTFAFGCCIKDNWRRCCKISIISYF